jgi:hypothetical protein
VHNAGWEWQASPDGKQSYAIARAEVTHEIPGGVSKSSSRTVVFNIRSFGSSACYAISRPPNSTATGTYCREKLSRRAFLIELPHHI